MFILMHVTTLYHLQLTEEPGEDEGSGSDESYEDVEVAPAVVYPDKMLMESIDLPDGYVHLVKNKRKNSKEAMEGETSTRETRKENEYGESLTVNLGLLSVNPIYGN